MSTIETIDYRNHTIKVMFDDDPLNPRTEWDNFGTMICFHKRYVLGDNENLIDYRDFESWEDIEQHLIKEEDAAVILPLSLYDHGGISMSVGRVGGWDCGQVGFIFVTREKILKDFDRKHLSKNLLDRVRKILDGEVETYDNYMTGQVYGYVVEPMDGYEGEECSDSCFGFYDQDDMVNQAKASIDFTIRQQEIPFIQGRV